MKAVQEKVAQDDFKNFMEVRMLDMKLNDPIMEAVLNANKVIIDGAESAR